MTTFDTAAVEPSEILRWMEVPDYANVFALGNLARWLGRAWAA